jgi:lysophospholipase L1-like esterase
VIDGGVATSTDAAAEAAAPDLAPYRIVGRFDSSDPAGPRFSWPGTSVRAEFSGASISMELLSNTGKDQFDVTIDGTTTLLKDVTSTRATYALATNLSPGNHTLVLTKRTESSVGVAQLFAIDATLVGTPPPPQHRIEMIGDSITAGYGVLGTDQTCHFTPGTEDEPMAWGALAASAMNASHTSIAWSGIGLIRNYDGGATGTMPDRYGRALGGDPTSTWTASQFEPDAIVIDLGTNDFTGAAADPGPAFQTGLTAFIATIRGIHPRAHIVLATSPMLTGDHHASQLAYVNGAKASDANTSVLDVPVAPAADGYGCDWHPSAITQQKMADELVSHLRPLLGW